MDIKKTTEEIEILLTDGKTEKAIDALIEATREASDDQHENAILLSGQFSQWKREKMLGVEQSDGELHRIELAILTVLKGKENPSLSRTAIATSSQSTSKKLFPIIGGILGILALGLVLWSQFGGSNEQTTTQTSTPVVIESASNTTGEEKTQIHPASTDIFLLSITEGTDLEAEKKYYTSNEKFYLVFQDDGNLVVYRNEEKGATFLWGSIQAGVKKGHFSRFQEDGNLVILDENRTWVWGTQTTDPKDQIGITSTGHLVVINKDNKVVWEGK